jgi:tetratricopeptide (TPR) repeat protein
MTDTPEHIENTDLEAAQPIDDMQDVSAYDQHVDYDDVSDESLEPLNEEPPQRVSLTRIEKLTQAIERNPVQPANYVYRGEAYLEKGQHELAAQDFSTAIELADTQAQTANWGYIYSALIDRARENLRRIQG